MKKALSFLHYDGTQLTDCTECVLNPDGRYHKDATGVCEKVRIFKELTGVEVRKGGVCGCTNGWLISELKARTWRQYIKDEGIDFKDNPKTDPLPTLWELEKMLKIKKQNEVL